MMVLTQSGTVIRQTHIVVANGCKVTTGHWHSLAEFAHLKHSQQLLPFCAQKQTLIRGSYQTFTFLLAVITRRVMQWEHLAQ